MASFALSDRPDCPLSSGPSAAAFAPLAEPCRCVLAVEFSQDGVEFRVAALQLPRFLEEQLGGHRG
jgi:hypothetical protein